MTKPPARRIGFLGLGYMGSRMARRLLDAHHRVTVYNRSADKARPLVDAGASRAETPRAVAEESDVILYSLADDAAVRDVILGPDGVLAGVRRGGTLIDLSTVLPDTSRAVSTAALSKGAAAIDAPVSGSTVQAEQGTLIIFVGGDREAYTSSASILDTLGRRVHGGQRGRRDDETGDQHAPRPGDSGARRGRRARTQGRAGYGAHAGRPGVDVRCIRRPEGKVRQHYTRRVPHRLRTANDVQGLRLDPSAGGVARGRHARRRSGQADRYRGAGPAPGT